MLMAFQTLRLRFALGVAAGGVASGLVAGLLAGCADGRDPLSSALSRAAANDLAASNVHGSFICTVRLAPAGGTGAPSVTCRPKYGALAGPTRMKAEDVVLGKQKVNVQLNITNPSFSSSTRIFSLSASITNLLTQPIGTTDGTTTTSAGTHFDGTNWLQFAVPVTSAFRAIYGTAAQNVYVVGDNGVVLLGTGL